MSDYELKETSKVIAGCRQIERQIRLYSAEFDRNMFDLKGNRNRTYELLYYYYMAEAREGLGMVMMFWRCMILVFRSIIHNIRNIA